MHEATLMCHPIHGCAYNVAPPPAADDAPVVEEDVPEPPPEVQPPDPLVPLPSFASLAHAIFSVIERDLHGGYVN